jgi:hypothetical protein
MADDVTTQPASSPAAGGGAPQTSPPPSQQQPETDWQSRFQAAERERDEYKSKYEKYKGYGEPEAVGQVYNQLRQIAADFQAGKLTYAQKQAAEAEVKRDEFEGWEDLEPRKQAERMRDLLRNEVTGLTKADMDRFREEMKQYQVNLGTQQQLLFRIIQLKTENPDLDIDELLKQSTEASAYGPQQILELQAKALRSPKEQQKAIEKAVEEAKAKWQQEQDAKRVPLSTRQAPRITGFKKIDPIARRQERVNNLVKRSDELNSRKLA